ncbi:MAG: hypothetical protein AVDCRST_MAG08-2574 [uncultured Acetobacteraceae bacterium]|jgi:hypothetical protein|uniref:Uncharacterized protein n=1 Tax=uncultured Acetobacteraceae bacterium TaxID=169975 RepID=A0A6J4IQ86_9PROT|nr:MAG: hypothetical protein AVDCRST_MAG08-2574 [uncultured Acetobacteraceae bacterium]
MAIEVSSDQWTGEAADDLAAYPRVYGEFPDRAALERAASQLEATAGFRQEDMTQGRAVDATDNAGQVAPPDEHPLKADARNLRQLGVGTGMAATAMAAAGVVIATGGAALPAVAAAAAAGGATAAAGEAVGKAAEPTSDGDPTKIAGHPAGVNDALALGVRAETEDKQVKAEEVMRSCGARRVWRVAS